MVINVLEKIEISSKLLEVFTDDIVIYIVHQANQQALVLPTRRRRLYPGQKISEALIFKAKANRIAWLA